MDRIGQKLNGFTLIEILVTITIIAVLAALLLPVFVNARAMARQADCISNLRQIGLAMAMYRSDFEELPPHISAPYPAYIPGPQVFVCRDDPVDGKHDGDDYLEGDRYLASGVSYTYIPNWKYAHRLHWWSPPPRYGQGKWGDSTPLAMCHWHWGKGRRWRNDLDTQSWGVNATGWVLILEAGGSVHKWRAETPVTELSPAGY